MLCDVVEELLLWLLYLMMKYLMTNPGVYITAWFMDSSLGLVGRWCFLKEDLGVIFGKLYLKVNVILYWLLNRIWIIWLINVEGMTPNHADLPCSVYYFLNQLVMFCMSSKVRTLLLEMPTKTASWMPIVNRNVKTRVHHDCKLASQTGF